MNIKKLFQNIKFIVLGSVIAIALSYVANAATFAVPSGAAPANNTSLPLNVSTADQVKQGGLAVTTFLANANAELDGNTYFGGVIHTDPTSTNATINFGGTDPKGIIRKVALAITGGFSNTGSITSTPLANTKMTTVCSDANGKVILCSAVNICSNIPNSTTLPAGYSTNPDGTCSLTPKRFYSIITSGDKSMEAFTNGLVVKSHMVYHTPGQKNGGAFVAALGLSNDNPFGWAIDDINTVHGTDLNAGSTRLLDVTENGNYDFKISSKGQIGIKGKFAADMNFIGVDFYMKVHHAADGTDQWIHLDNNVQKGTSDWYHEPYPVPGKTSIDYGAFVDGGSNQVNPFFGVNFGGNGNKYVYVPYDFSFHQSVPLNTQDTVDVEALIYGYSTTGTVSGYTDNIVDQLAGTVWSFVSGSFHNSPNNFTYSISSPYHGTIFDVTETPTP